MKKGNIILFPAIFATIALVLASFTQVIPVVYAYTEVDCKCTHWYIPDENTVRDIMTGVGLDADRGGYLFTHVWAQYMAASGGTYAPRPNLGTFCYRKYMDINYNWFGPWLDYCYVNWYPHDIPGGPVFVYAYYRDKIANYYYDGVNYARRFQGLATNWFQNPNDPSSWWLCGTIWADVGQI